MRAEIITTWFCGKGPGRCPTFASQRGTLDKYGKPFKGDVPGNDKTYGVNLVNTHSDTLHVYEAAIDAMSDMELREIARRISWCLECFQTVLWKNF